MATTGALGRVRTRVVSETALGWLTLTTMLCWQIGAYIDKWYHLHYGFAIESFITWPHALLYGGWGATSLVAMVYLIESWQLGIPRDSLVPPGFRAVLIGVGLFGMGGIFDFGWHAAYGFEVRQEALLTPAHLWLDIAFLVTVCGLLRYALHRRGAAGAPTYRPRSVDLPVMAGIGFIFSAVMWNLTFIAPLSIDFAAAGANTGHLAAYERVTWGTETAQIAGTAALLLHSVILALFVVGPLRHLRLPGGTIAVVLLYEGIEIAAVTGFWLALPAVAGAAIVGEAIWARLQQGGRESLAGEFGYWVLGGAVPAAQWALYLALLAAFGGGVVWTAHLVAGLPAMAALYGAIAALLIAPPRWLRQAPA